MTNQTHPKIFVTGATGQLGRLVIEQLIKRVPAGTIVAGVRSLESVAARDLNAAGVETRLADYTSPDMLSVAFQGVDRLLLISSTSGPDRVIQHQNVIDAARAANVGLIAYTSLLNADKATSGLGEDHKATEAALRDAGVPFVLLRHGWYIENHTPSVQPALQHGAVIGSAGQGRFSSATRADYAEGAAVVLTSDGQEGRIYELAGDESYSLTDLAQTISTIANRDVTYQDMPKERFKQTLMGMGLPEPVAEIIAESDVSASNGELENNDRRLSALIGRPTTSYRQIMQAAVSAT